MKVSYNWLKEYIDLNETTPHDLAEQITLTGIEVDAVHEAGKSLENIVVGKVLTCEQMEDSDHLNITTVDIGEETGAVQIVCGAPNVAAGQNVVVAKPGAILPGEFKIKKSKIRGFESNGMICALDELGYADSVIPKYAEAGIYVLNTDAIPGEDARPYLGLDDTIIELDITPNRADAMSMRGVAFEAGAILSQKPQLKKVETKEDASEKTTDKLSVEVESSKDTPIYKMRIVKDVTVKESPLWLQRKLMNAGIRPIDNIVDITNFILLEYGQPLHAFDYEKVGSERILVRRAKNGETLETLDGKERILSPDHLVITNGEKPIALAGVMGGANSDVSKETRTIAIEAAVFNQSLIRKTASTFNLRSEASARFERGINLSTVQEALDHAAQLMAELGEGKILSKTVSVVSKEAKDVKVSIAVETLNKKIGTNLTEEEISTIFDRLGFNHSIQNREVTVSVPPRRWDISIEADLVEEVARIYGYNNIPATLPTTESIPGELNEKQRLTRFIRHYLEGSGLSQAISYALTTPKKAKQFSLSDAKTVQLDYPMSEDHQTLRQSIVSGLLDDAEYNSARQQKNVALYEVGHVFLKEEGKQIPKEEDHVAGLLTGSLHEKSWIEEAWPVDFYSIKGIVEELFAHVGLKDKISYEADTSLEEMHPGRTALIKLSDETIGFVGQVHPVVSNIKDLEDTYVFELNIDALANAKKDPAIYKMIPKFPGTARDIALVIDEDVTHEEVISIIEQNGGKWLRKISLFDLYQGENIEKGKKSVAYSLSYLNPEATLKEEEITSDFERVKQALQQEIKAEIR